ncbi:MAG: extensin family protein [Oceanicaulis sp.]
MDDRTTAARTRMIEAAAALAVTAGLCLAGLTGLRALDALPDRYKAWTALRLDDPPAPLDRAKMLALNAYPACLDALTQSAARVRPAQPLSAANGCGYEEAVVLERSAHLWSAPQPMVMRCPLAAKLYLWERRVVAPAAQAHFGQDVAEIRQYGIYSCRTVNRRPGARLSEHGKANAVDVAGFVLEDGRVISVREGWTGEADEAAFLREVHAGACGLFRGVIGPEGDAAHADHFHMDMGRWTYCR